MRGWASLVFCILLFSILLGCSSNETPIEVISFLVEDPRSEEGKQLHILFYEPEHGASALLIITEEVELDSLALPAWFSLDAQQVKERLEDLLGLTRVSVIDATGESALSLFTILDSLDAYEREDQQQQEELFKTRWTTLFRNARLFSSDQAIVKLLEVTDPVVSQREVRKALITIAENGVMPVFIEYRADSDGKPLYDGAYGKELVKSLINRLEKKP